MRVEGSGLRVQGSGFRVEDGSYLRLIDVVYHSTLGLRIINKKKKKVEGLAWAPRQGAKGADASTDSSKVDIFL